jgi:hypothetical protein
MKKHIHAYTIIVIKQQHMVMQKTKSDTLVSNVASDNASLLRLGTGSSSHCRSLSSP